MTVVLGLMTVVTFSNDYSCHTLTYITSYSAQTDEKFIALQTDEKFIALNRWKIHRFGGKLIALSANTDPKPMKNSSLCAQIDEKFITLGNK